MAKPLDFIGTIDRIKWRSPDSPWLIASCEDGTTVTGNAGEGELYPGITYQFFGEWEDHSRFGRQFKFKQFQKQEPHSRHGVVCYLARYAPGVGSGIAGQLFDQFGSTAIAVLRTQPEQAARSIPRLTEQKARGASEALKALQRLEDTKVDLINLFAGRGFPHVLVDQVIAKAGIFAPACVRRDPFWLLVNGFGGCGFSRCDRLYCDLGLPQDRIKRQVICLWHCLHEESNGSTWIDERRAVAKMGEKVGGCDTKPERAIKIGVRSGWVAQHVDGGGRRWLAEGRKAANEKFLAERVAEVLGGAVCLAKLQLTEGQGCDDKKKNDSEEAECSSSRDERTSRS